MTITHIEVATPKAHPSFEAGQLLKVIRDTPCFFHVLAFDGTEYRVSKKTNRIIGTLTTFIRTNKQPECNL